MAPFYRLLAREPFGFTPDEVDSMELWQIGEILGLNEVDDPAGPVTEDEFRAKSAELIAERVRRHREGLPQPEAPSTGMTASSAMIAALRERRRAREAQQQGE